MDSVGKEGVADGEIRRGSFWLSSRFGLSVIGFFGFINLYALRVNHTVAVVCMLNHTALTSGFNDVQNQTNVACGSELMNKTKEDGPFLWPKEVQGLVLGAFYWGYLVTQIPAGLLAERYGAKHVFGWSMVVAGVATLICPVCAQFSFVALIVARVIIGLTTAVAFPAMHAMWSNWAPPMERSILLGFNYAGAQIGNVITFPMSSMLCATIGWESIYYVFGAVGLIWCILWLLLTSSTPQTHSRIRKAESDYILQSLSNQNSEKNKKPTLKEMPWFAIWKSMAVWAIIVAHTAGNFGTYLMLTSLPMYLKQNGLISALPYIAYFLGINIACNVADYLRSHQIMSTARVRKMMLVVSLCGQASLFVGAGHCRCGQETLAVVLIVSAQGFSGLQYAGVMTNHVDIAPQYAGTLFGISNMFATISGIVAPSLVAALTTHETREEWAMVFWVAFSVLVFGAMFFLVFAQGELQPWAISNKSETEVVLLEPIGETKEIKQS